MRILVVDDHALIREALANLLPQLDPSVQVVEALSADEARRAIATAAPTAGHDAAPFALVLLDLTLPGADGMNLLEDLRRLAPEIPIVVLSGNDSRASILGAIERGAMGFISKRSSTAILTNALRLVLAGGVYIPREALELEGAATPVESQPPEADVAARLRITPRQLQILALVVQGMPNKRICRELDIADSTVKAHVSAILRILGVETRTEAVLKVSRLGLQLPPVCSATAERLAAR